LARSPRKSKSLCPIRRLRMGGEEERGGRAEACDRSEITFAKNAWGGAHPPRRVTLRKKKAARHPLLKRSIRVAALCNFPQVRSETQKQQRLRRRDPQGGESGSKAEHQRLKRSSSGNARTGRSWGGETSQWIPGEENSEVCLKFDIQTTTHIMFPSNKEKEPQGGQD